MPSDHEPVRPTPFEVAEPPPARGTDSRHGTPAWVMPALGGLLLLALLVVFWLPDTLQPAGSAPAVSGPAVSSPPADSAPPADRGGTAPGAAPGAAPAQAATPGGKTSPWSDAQLARLRLEAQEVLAELLDLQFALEERGVQQWGAGDFSRAGAAAAEGDALYRNQQYEQATAQYRQSLELLRSLEQRLPAELERLLAEAERAIEAGEADSAGAALALAARIEPDNAAAAALRARLEALPQVMSLLAAAADAEAADDLASAQLRLEEAVGRDPAHRRAAAELERVAAAVRERGFRRAMSAGYAALEAGRFDAASEAFTDAGKLQPGAAEAASALQEVTAARVAAALSALKERGQGHEESEQWQEAVAVYERARELDANVVFARRGLERSRQRAQLDAQFRAVLDEPGQLAEVAVAERVAGFLDEARALSPRGPVLEAQIERIETLLRRANTPVEVTLRSDSETEVVVQRVARLGRFERHELSLRPGSYTAVGTRIGYRDVRRDFEVSPDGADEPITVICTEPI